MQLRNEGVGIVKKLKFGYKLLMQNRPKCVTKSWIRRNAGNNLNTNLSKLVRKQWAINFKALFIIYKTCMQIHAGSVAPEIEDLYKLIHVDSILRNQGLEPTFPTVYRHVSEE
jgi:hypothetical protein